MPKKPFVPAYRRHRASGQAIVTLNGVDHYLGRWNSPESRAEYDRVTSEWLIRGRRLGQAGGPSGVLVKELILGYHGHAAATLPVSEVAKIRLAMRVVKELYGKAPAAKFGPVAFKAVRRRMIDAGLCISTIRARMGAIRRMVAWGVENEFLPADALQRIEAVAGLRAGRDGVKPQRKVKPAPDEHIKAILPHLGPVVRAMVEVQALTGMRPSEVCRMTTGQIDRSGEIWLYRPVEHKTADLGKDRTVPLGPKAQEVLKPWLKADPDAPLFSPIEATRLDYANRGKDLARARTPKRNPKRRPGQAYDRNSYKNAIARACRRAGVPVFRPNRIRHSFATRVRHEFGLEHAQVTLGHSKADVTQVYAERDLSLALEVAKKIG